MAKFHRLALMGEGLRNGDPALALRNYVLGATPGTRNGIKAEGNRRDISHKTLAAIYADLAGNPMSKLMVNSAALPFFRAAYKGRTVDKLVEPWQSTDAQPSINGAAARE